MQESLSDVRGGVTLKKRKNLGQSPNKKSSEFPFLRNHKFSFPILQNMYNSEKSGLI